MIAGRPIDQDYLNRLRLLIEEKGLTNNITFLGHLSAEELRTLYKKCTLFIFPSTVETFGNPLVEAMACGAPIVCSNAAAMPEVLGDAGSYFDPNDIESICAAVTEALDTKRFRDDMGEKARKRAKKFSWNKTKELTVKNLFDAASVKYKSK